MRAALLNRLAVAVALAAAAVSPSLAQRSPEQEVKAAVVVNLLSFIQWPKGTLEAEKEFRLCVPAIAPIGAALAKLGNSQVSGLPLVIRKFSGSHELSQCHAILVGASDTFVMRAAEATQGLPVLLMGEGAGVLERGAMIGIDVAGGKIVFDVDLVALRKANLTASAKLLRLVRRLVE